MAFVGYLVTETRRVRNTILLHSPDCPRTLYVVQASLHCHPDCPWTHYVAQASFQLFLLSLQTLGVTGMCYHVWFADVSNSWKMSSTGFQLPLNSWTLSSIKNAMEQCYLFMELEGNKRLLNPNFSTEKVFSIMTDTYSWYETHPLAVRHTHLLWDTPTCFDTQLLAAIRTTLTCCETHPSAMRHIYLL